MINYIITSKFKFSKDHEPKTGLCTYFQELYYFKDLELFNENEVSIFIYIQYTIYKYLFLCFKLFHIFFQGDFYSINLMQLGKNLYRILHTSDLMFDI